MRGRSFLEFPFKILCKTMLIPDYGSRASDVCVNSLFSVYTIYNKCLLTVYQCFVVTDMLHHMYLSMYLLTQYKCGRR